jgi:hypothetical protein
VGTTWAGDFVFSSSLPIEQAERITQDLDAFKNSSLSDPDPEMIRIMGIPDASVASMTSWLTARVHYIVEEDFQPFNGRVLMTLSSFRYPHPGIFPIEEEPTVTLGIGNPSRLVMNNLGASLYQVGKSSGALLLVAIDGVGKVPVKSPRVGIIQVGDGMFYTGFKNLQGLSIDSQAYRSFRVASLYHEARHSDGNGVSLGFSHAVCPSGHEYEGMKACDRNSNGPYTIEALLIKSMMRSCQDCTVSDLEAMKLMAINYKNRAIAELSSYPDYGFQTRKIKSAEWDATPEGSLF